MSRDAYWPSKERQATPPRPGGKSPVTVSLWDNEQRRYTIVRTDQRGVELVGPAGSLVAGEEAVLGISFLSGDVFVCVKVVSMAPGRTNATLSRIRAQWLSIWGTDPSLTRRFLSERLRVPARVFRRLAPVAPKSKGGWWSAMMNKVTAPNMPAARSSRLHRSLAKSRPAVRPRATRPSKPHA